ncbi:MAG: hypothetical protein EBV73_06380, partial [Rhodocyclales bacterium]|nr:hypothetical protein [Rhodocyclales bacterium]
VPWQMYFPEAAKQIAANPKQAPYAWGTFKMGDYNQPVTQELVDRIAPIEEAILAGRQHKATGGEVRYMADGKRTGPTLDEMRQVIRDVDVPGKIKSVARGVPQMVTWPLDILGAISEGVGITPEGGTVGSTDWMTNKGYLPPQQPGVANQTVEGISSMGPAGLISKIPQATRSGLGALGNMFRGSHAPAPTHVPAMAGGGDVVKSLIKKALGTGEGVAARTIEGSPHTYPPIAEGPWMRDLQQSHPVDAAGLPTTREGWDALGAERLAAQNKVDYMMGNTGPVKPPLVQYMGKYRQGTPEERALQRQEETNTIRMLMKLRGME